MNTVKCKCGNETTKDFYHDYGMCRSCARKPILLRKAEINREIESLETEYRLLNAKLDRMFAYDTSEADYVEET